MTRAAIAASLLLAASSCSAPRSKPSPPPPDTVGVDLLAELDRGEVRGDFLTLPLLRASMVFDVAAWQELPGPRPAFRSRGLRQRVTLPFATSSGKTLRLRLRAGGGRGLAVAVGWQGRRLTTLKLGERDEAFELSLPKASSPSGTLAFEIQGKPAAGRQPPRHFVLSGLLAAPEGTSLETPEERDGLGLAAGSQLDFSIRPSAPSRLELAVHAPSGPARVQLAWQDDLEEVDLVDAELARGERLRREVDIPASAGRPVRLRLRNVAQEAELELERLRLVSPREVAAASAPLPGRPNVVIFLVDTLRADALGAYGQAQPTSPRFDAFAKESLFFTDAWAQSSWTVPAVASIFTGREPDALGAHGPWGQLPAEASTLAEALRARGYRCGAFVANGLLMGKRGFGQGFEVWRDEPRGGSTGRPGSQVVSEALEWLASVSSPYFLYLHLMEPHAPYAPPEDVWRLFRPAGYRGSRDVHGLAASRRPPPEGVAYLRSAYLGDVAQADSALGALLDALGSSGALQDSLFVFLSDHGEEFFEHSEQGHGKSLYQEVLRIPLAVRLPGGRRGGIEEKAPVQHVDLMPTLLGLIGAKAPAVDGRDLSAFWLGAPAPALPVLASRLLFERRTYDKTAARLGPLKLILHGEDAARREAELFDLARDPGETRDVLAEHPVVAGYLRGELRARRRASAAGSREPPASADPEALERLRALGYVQ